MTNTNTNKLAYSVAEAAQALGVSLPIAYDLCNRSDFPAVRISTKRIVIPVDALNQWLEKEAQRLDV